MYSTPAVPSPQLQGDFSGTSSVLLQAEVLRFGGQVLLILDVPKGMRVASLHPATLCHCDKVLQVTPH